METKKSKYDTNPLDPDVERKAEESWAAGSKPTQQVGGPTREVGSDQRDNTRQSSDHARQNVYSEAPTQRYENPPLEQPYPSVFVPPTYAPPHQYQQQNIYRPPVSNAPSQRQVPGIGIHERWASMLAYAPYVGIVASLAELFLVPRREVKVRFHASQGLALHIAILLIQTIFSAIRLVSDSGAGGFLFRTAAFIFLLISMIRVWRGKPHLIPPLAEPAQWFNQHIEPRTQA